jgi:tRNA modification GTPase
MLVRVPGSRRIQFSSSGSGSLAVLTRPRLFARPIKSRGLNFPVNLDDTIVAVATPPGSGGIGVVRLAGPQARSIALPMLRLRHELEPGCAVFGELIEPDMKDRPAGPAQRIDEVVVTYFAKPHSYTSDDVVEISAHGSPVVMRYIVELALAGGARLAEPGEFTMRAFLNGRIDLTQAEAVRDLIESQTLYQAKVAAQQLGGALSKRLQPVKQQLVELIALLEAGIDFAEDDVSVPARAQILERMARVRAPLEQLAGSFTYGKIVREGMTLAIIGRPNVGKSSLFNRLVERERAIVTATPGTTRDLVTETVSLGGIPLHLVDTAGIRGALDEAESIGIRKSREALSDADLVLVVLDASQSKGGEDEQLLREVGNRPAIVVENKSDLAAVTEPLAKDNHPGPGGRDLRSVRTSALTGDGIGELRALILRHITGESGAYSESGFITNVRHQSLIRDSLAALDHSRAAVETMVPHEMLLLDLYNALRLLDEITGATTTDDILNLIFSRFCIGK